MDNDERYDVSIYRQMNGDEDDYCQEEEEEMEQNQWEEIFDSFLDLIEFQLVRYPDGFGVIDFQHANLGNIENDRFDNTEWLLDRLEIYENDYIVDDLIEEMEQQGIDIQYNNWEDLLQYRDKMPSDYNGEFNYLDLICNHGKDVNLENCTYIIKN